MILFFGRFRNFFRFRQITIDNTIFRLHYILTVPILLIFSFVLIGRQYFDDSIDCFSRSGLRRNYVNSYCWVESTYSSQTALSKKVGEEVPYPGVDKYTPGDEKVHHVHYQWICFVLIFQAILFYAPRYFWRCKEGGLIKSFIRNHRSPEEDNESLETTTPLVLSREERRKLLVEYFTATLGHHNIYSHYYSFSELMNAVNVIGQIFLINALLGGMFYARAMEYRWNPSNEYYQMLQIFPKLAKCSLYMYGSSGDVQRHEALCVLPMNAISEKIYLFLFFWFVILTILSFVAIGYRMMLYFSPWVRTRVLRVHVNLSGKRQMEKILDKCNIGDWFVLHLLGKNMDSLNFRDFIDDLSVNLREKFHEI